MSCDSVGGCVERRGGRLHNNDVCTTRKYIRTKVDSHVKYGLASYSSGARARRSLVPQTLLQE